MSLCIACEVEAVVGREHPVGNECRLCFYLPRMAERDRLAILLGLSGALSAGKISTIMTKNGRPVSKAAVQRHQAHSRQEPTTA